MLVVLIIFIHSKWKGASQINKRGDNKFTASFPTIYNWSKNFCCKNGTQMNIPLIFYGEMPGEYGKNISHQISKFGTKTGDNSQKGFELDPLKVKNLKIVLLVVNRLKNI